jgi:hypothetical protein
MSRQHRQQQQLSGPSLTARPEDRTDKRARSPVLECDGEIKVGDLRLGCAGFANSNWVGNFYPAIVGSGATQSPVVVCTSPPEMIVRAASTPRCEARFADSMRQLDHYQQHFETCASCREPAEWNGARVAVVLPCMLPGNPNHANVQRGDQLIFLRHTSFQHPRILGTPPLSIRSSHARVQRRFVPRGATPQRTLASC